MDENTRTALDVEAPVNPYSLLDALNAASQRTGTLWLLFLAVMAWLVVTVAGVTHRDLLLDSGVLLPILGARIDLGRFFVLAPALLALLHLGLVARFVLLARKTLEFSNALRLLESTDRRSHPLRLELDSFFFVQAIAGPDRNRLVSGLLNAIGWFTILALPIALLLYLQVAFLPVHDAAITTLQRAIVLADIVLMALVGAFLLRTETGWLGAVLRLGLHNPGSLAAGLAALAAAAFVSVSLATVPGGSSADAPESALFGVFPRNLAVADADLGFGGQAPAARRSIGLRGRDLRFARLDRVDLRLADLTGANLDGASLAGADLGGARLRCAGSEVPQPAGDRRAAPCASARGADFTGARLADASLAGADLRGAKFGDASLEGADLTGSLISGARFERAGLQRADLSSTLSQQGASFLLANLQGARLVGARLQAADFTGASLAGANLSLAHLAGAVLRDADLEGADLQSAKLYGADLRGAKLRAADLAGAQVWRALPPAADMVDLADLANIVMRSPDKEEIEALKTVAADLLKQPPGGDWGVTADGQAWGALLRASEAAMADSYSARLAERLGRLACRSRFADGAVAAGVAGRAARQGFKGDQAAVYDRLKAADCPASRTVPARLLLDLAVAVEAKKGE
jgi:uncharacterized protein YjbI with pentapeptide repeats